MTLRTTPQGNAGGSSLLRTDLDTMVSASQFVRDAADSIHQQLMHLRTHIDNLKGGWKSPAASAYCDQQMVDWDARASAVRDALYTIADNLGSSQKAYNEMEEDNLLGITQAGQAMNG
ncbi:WXG100 family type VII secretion target [Actinoallomurus soli]|uniref:WXG100 family type VII secretion target n=1 Tax=Actinoallomurus soli TaxID=2952535 RepID=UPI00209221D5|nr:WXG100 family type VII secretion target [Actinoallomurus soli]MCO5971376.1 WXG100 family type VII secretion target [Actinoallomurus soli]